MAAQASTYLWAGRLERTSVTNPITFMRKKPSANKPLTSKWRQGQVFLCDSPHLIFPGNGDAPSTVWLNLLVQRYVWLSFPTVCYQGHKDFRLKPSCVTDTERRKMSLPEGPCEIRKGNGRTVRTERQVLLSQFYRQDWDKKWGDEPKPQSLAFRNWVSSSLDLILTIRPWFLLRCKHLWPQ